MQIAPGVRCVQFCLICNQRGRTALVSSLWLVAEQVQSASTVVSFRTAKSLYNSAAGADC
uniref:Uncharacterized protein n=1 Tax=Arundo donax TaxID=35708 RepID=A0A0A9BM41_ARUDO